MLRQRLVTAAVLGFLVVWGIVALSTRQLALVFGALTLVAGWEWGRLAGLRAVWARALYVLLIAGLLLLCWRALAEPEWSLAVLYGGSGWWLVALVWVMNYPFGAGTGAGWVTLKALAGVMVLLPAWLALLLLHQRPEHGPYWMIFILGLVWVADSGAYLSGRRWGRHKLARRVSPGKTWEGVYGALLSTVVYAFVAGSVLGVRGYELLMLVGLSALVVPVSIIGDLYESMFKRHLGMKDSGHLLPGHGGILDRIDSLTAAAPVFVLGVLWLHLHA